MVILSWANIDGSKTTLAFDATPKQGHTATAEVTDHNVEKGIPVADNVRPMPQKLVLETLTTNTPISTPKDSFMRGAKGSQVRNEVTVNGQTIGWSSLQFDQEFDRVRDVFGALVTLGAVGTLFTCTTSLNTYENMVITEFSVNLDVKTGASLPAQITFKELRIVETETVDTPAAKHKPKNRGAKPPTEATQEEKDKAKAGLKSVWASSSANPFAD